MKDEPLPSVSSYVDFALILLLLDSSCVRWNMFFSRIYFAVEGFQQLTIPSVIVGNVDLLKKKITKLKYSSQVPFDRYCYISLDYLSSL